MTAILVRAGELDLALRRLRTVLLADGLQRELKRRRRYITPSERKRAKVRNAAWRRAKAERRSRHEGRV